MSRRSRQSKGPSISLFSFQDVMMTIMGILILMTLLMSLELTEAVAESATAASSTSDPAPDLQPLERELTQLKQRYDQMVILVTRLAEVSGSGRSEYDYELQRLESRYAEISRLQEIVDQLKKQLPERIAEAERVRKIESEIQRLETKALQLRQQLENQRLNPRITYILQSGQQKQPIICVLNGQYIGLGSVDAAAPAVWFKHSQPADQIRDLKMFLQECDPLRQFVVILLKPSAFDTQYATVHEAVVSSGFEVGLDLINEEANVLP